MRNITKEEIEVVEKYNIQFKEENGYIVDPYSEGDLAVNKILHLYIKDAWYCILKSDNHHPLFQPMLNFSTVRQFKNARVGQKYLMWNSDSDDKVYSVLKEIDRSSDSPFVSEKGNKYKYIKVFNEF